MWSLPSSIREQFYLGYYKHCSVVVQRFESWAEYIIQTFSELIFCCVTVNHISAISLIYEYIAASYCDKSGI
jgi:beta-glucosidase/6-phospho-beta-glucosidase/beta-galactosidase